MAYFVDSNGNSKKVGAIIKPYYRHQLKCELRGQQEELLYTAYLDSVSTYDENLEGYTIDDFDIIPNESIIYCYDENNNKYTYLIYDGRTTGVGHLYSNIENQTSSVQVDFGSFRIIEDEVTTI